MEKPIATHSVSAEIIKKYGITPKKGLGQNFLIEPNIAEKIIKAAGVDKDDCIIEIGPGLGALTQMLAQTGARILAVEIDKSLAGALEEIFKSFENVEIIKGDILKTDVKKLLVDRGLERAKVCANLPYYITTPILMMLLESALPLESITAMVQKEVAQRLAADAGDDEYGSISLAARFYADIALNATVPRNCFVPRPAVDSAIVTLRLRKSQFMPMDEEFMFKCIRAAFGHRRKTLVNCLHERFDTPKEELAKMLESCGFNEMIRGEALDLKGFCLLSDTLNPIVELAGEKSR
ncbi:MAG: 16S rRNA (adenine(1518)-N(6)/adenine(1519)-N(6))-dimethyltransferase RsmA [Clostridiales bacterium]|jgi:16S rRNA (adenine1518-N6/adenine1519-N6)-dimethyltransferase|nr:16S rRNA (adenine(1518)-N(6)/adenine(1519)-N(6))-dimethyltransferase RsmA [Clostridiales bacterium]